MAISYDIISGFSRKFWLGGGVYIIFCPPKSGVLLSIIMLCRAWKATRHGGKFHEKIIYFNQKVITYSSKNTQKPSKNAHF